MTMKKIYILLLLLGVLSIRCSSALDNSITIKSIATEDVYVNILGKTLTIKSGTTQVIQNISKGTYSYQTTYKIPTSVSGTTVEGNASGNFVVTAGTKVNIYYASRIQVSQATGGSGTAQSSYVLVASISSSDPVTSSTTSSN